MKEELLQDKRPKIGNTMLVAAFPGTGKSHYCNVDADYNTTRLCNR